jgi:hypothetical protein
VLPGARRPLGELRFTENRPAKNLQAPGINGRDA